MRGETNAAPSGGLRVIASGNNYPAREVMLAQPAKFVLLVTKSSRNGNVYMATPGWYIEPLDGYRVTLSADGNTLTFTGSMPELDFYALG